MRIREIKDLVDGTSDSSVAVDGSVYIVAWNPAAEAMLGLTTDEAIGKMCGEIIKKSKRRRQEFSLNLSPW